MALEIISNHFVAFLGQDVGVSVGSSQPALKVTLYRPDPLGKKFVTLAFQALEQKEPTLASQIGRVTVAFDGPLGRTERGVDISAQAQPSLCGH